jgi:hypothetical protein
VWYGLELSQYFIILASVALLFGKTALALPAQYPKADTGQRRV